MTAPNPIPADIADSEADGLFRMMGVSFRRYARDPQGRVASARLMLTTSLALYARLASVGEASVTAAETVAELVQAERRAGR